MQNKIITAVFALSTLLIGATVAQAGPTPGVGHRQHNQLHRIHQGIHNGTLNAKEAAKLLHAEARIQRKKRRFKADGVVTIRERARLHHALNRQHVRIHRKRHN